MNINYIIKEQVIDRYLSNTLTDKELREFEIYYLNHPEILDEVDIKRELLIRNSLDDNSIN